MQEAQRTRNIFIVLAVFLGVTTLLWLIGKPNLNFIFKFPYLSLTQIAGLIAVSLTSLNLLLSARLSLFENLFGGLDKVYKLHGMTGRIAFALMHAHPIFLLFSASKLSQALDIYFLNFSNDAYNFGKFALLWFTILISLTIFIRLPYHIWRRTHQAMIIPVIFAALHVITIESDVAVNIPLRYWILGIMAMGIIAYVYKMFLYPAIGPKFEYKIKSVKAKGSITEVILSPPKKALLWEPGQFVFATFNSPKISTEEHPFSISSSPDEKYVRLSMKNSGDFTSTVHRLKVGDKVKLYGPYGQFGRRALSTQKEVLMIAGGIGVTPFLSIVNYIKNKGLKTSYKIIYSHNDGQYAYINELKNVSGKNLWLYNSSKEGRLNSKTIFDKLGKPNGKIILLCGPRNMMISLSKQLIAAGVKRNNLIFEDFELK